MYVNSREIYERLSFPLASLFSYLHQGFSGCCCCCFILKTKLAINTNIKLHLTGFKYSLMIKTLIIKSVHLHQNFEDSWIATIEHVHNTRHCSIT